MKRWIGWMAMCLGVAGYALGEAPPAGERYDIVEVSTFKGVPEFKILTLADSKALSDELRLESKCIDKAYAKAQAEWKARKMGEGKPFPMAKPQPRSARKIGTYTSQEAATKKSDELTEQASKLADSKDDKEQKKVEKMDAAKKKDYQEKLDKRKKNLEDAQTMFVEQLDTVRAEAMTKEQERKAKVEGGGESGGAAAEKSTESAEKPAKEAAGKKE